MQKTSNEQALITISDAASPLDVDTSILQPPGHEIRLWQGQAQSLRTLLVRHSLVPVWHVAQPEQHHDDDDARHSTRAHGLRQRA